MRATALLTGLLLAAPVVAGEADICYSVDQPLGTIDLPTFATVFECPIAGNKTMQQLAADGWKVVQLSPVVTSASTQAHQLVIQR